MPDELTVFSSTLLAAALDHHERYWVNGDHDEANCALCHLVVDVSVATGISIAQMKAEIVTDGESMVC